MPTEAEIQAIKDAEKITFTDEQKAKINDLIKDAQGRAGNDARAEAATFKAQLHNVQAELDTAKEALKHASKAEKKEAKGDVEALQSTIDEMKRAQQLHVDETRKLQGLVTSKDEEVKTARSEAINIRKEIAIANAASKINFVNNEVISKLTKDNISWDADKNKFVVIGVDGSPRLNGSFDPMSLDEFYTEYASQNPYLVRGDVKGGSGSKESSHSGVMGSGKFEVKQIFGKESNSRLAMQLMKENPTEYHRMKALAISSGLLK
jgi:hypothetical protein